MATETCIFLIGHIYLVWSEQQLHLLPTSFISFRDLKFFTLKFFPIANHQLLHNFTRQLTFNAPNFSLDILLKLRDLGRHLNKRFLIENIYRNLLITYNNFFFIYTRFACYVVRPTHDLAIPWYRTNSTKSCWQYKLYMKIIKQRVFHYKPNKKIVTSLN